MFTVTKQMRQELRKQVGDIMRGERKLARPLRIPTYLGGDFVRPGKNPRSTEALLNPVDPKPGPPMED
jgi:hypothetical protein